MLRSNVTQAVPFFWVHDINATIRFYIDGLGFTMTKKWLDEGKLRWCWLDLGAAALMVQEFWTEGRDRNVPYAKVGIGVNIYFICNDALAIYREIMGRGVQVKRPFVGNGMWVTQVVDPDGYHLSFESPTDAPEDTVFPENA